MFVLYVIGYVIALFILFSCRGSYVKSPLMHYLDDMGVTKPFSCTNGNMVCSDDIYTPSYTCNNSKTLLVKY